MPHQLAYLALALVYLVLAAILFAEGAFAHCGCVAAAAIVYALLAWSQNKRDEEAE